MKAATLAESQAWDAFSAAAPKNTSQAVIVKDFPPAEIEACWALHTRPCSPINVEFHTSKIEA